MAKRIKRVFTNSDQVIHLWANQTQEDARCKNVYFQGKSVYSYGHHYELGRLMEFNGVTVAVINDTGYSHTTRKHIWSAWGAVSHMPRVKTKGLFTADAIADALLDVQGDILEKMFGHFSALKFWSEAKWDKREQYGLEGSITEFNNTCAVLGRSDLKIEVTEDYVNLYNDHIKTRRVRDAEMNTPEALAAKQAKALKRASESVAKWRVGGPLNDVVRRLEPQLIRVHGDEVQTSKGATVPLGHALRLLGMVERGIAKQGERVGHFALKGVYGDTVKIGCHSISLTEAKQVLKTEKVQMALKRGEV